MSGVIDLTKEDFAAWISNPVTQTVFNELARKKEESLLSVVYTTISSNSAEEIALKVKEVTGEIKILDDILNVDWKDEIVAEEETNGD